MEIARTRSIDSTLSSTTPDATASITPLPAAPTLGITGLLGLGLGALVGRSPLGMLTGAVVGAGFGASLLGIDRFTGGAVGRLVDMASLDRRAQILFVLQHPTKPWIASLGLGVARDARTAQTDQFGEAEPLDGAQDAFRHAFAAALFSLRSMRDHGVDPSEAHDLALGAGDAHEADGQDSNDAYSRAMDEANNLTGTQVVGDGRARAGEDADADGWVTEAALRGRVLAALADGSLQVVDRAGDDPMPRPTTASDIPAH